MSYATVRAAVQAWIKGQAITGVQQVYKDAPWWIAGPTFAVDGQTLLYGAALFVHLDRSAESRITLPAPQPPSRTIGGGFVGQKNVTYICTIGIIYRFLMPDALGEDKLEDQWVDGLDSIIDALKDRLRQDPNLGAPAVIFQAGQQNDGILMDMDLPTIDSGYVQTFARLQFSLDEIITA